MPEDRRESELVAEIAAVVERVARALIDADRAQLDQDSAAGWGAVLRPVAPGAATIAAELSEGPWIDLAVGPNTDGPVFELYLDEDWQAALAACVLSVVEGRYSFRRRKARIGWIETMDFGPGEFSPGKVESRDLTGGPSAEEIARYLAY